jgi:hypothetical protein
MLPLCSTGVGQSGMEPVPCTSVLTYGPWSLIAPDASHVPAWGQQNVVG